MKKFLAVFDGYKMSKSTIEYSIQLSQKAQAHLVGVFLDEFFYHSYSFYNIISTQKNYQKVFKNLDAKDARKRDEAVQQFQKACEKAKINFSIHRDKKFALLELKHESMFADLVIINEHDTFTRGKEKLPTAFIKDLLIGVQCPVLLVPWNFKPIDKIVLLYDGRPSSLYAIKMFSYLFGTVDELPVIVYTVNEDDMANLRLPENKLMREFIKRHFPKAEYKIEKGNSEERIVGFMKNSGENELVVLGAYQRSEVSRWFKTSMADILMKELNSPLFIAHSR